MGNWREYQIERLANDQEAAIDYLQLTLDEYLVDGDLHFFLKGLQTFIEAYEEMLKQREKHFSVLDRIRKKCQQ